MPPHSRSSLPLTVKILIQSMLLLVVLFATLGAGVYYFQRAIEREMDAKSADILQQIQVQVESGGELPLDDVLANLRKEAHVDAITLFNEEREVEASDWGPGMSRLDMDAPGRGLQIEPVRDLQGRLLMTAYHQTLLLEVDGATLGYVKVGLALQPQTAVVRALQSRVIWALVGAFLVTTGALCYTVISALRPLRDLSEHLRAVGEGDLEQVHVSANSREVGFLQETFNRMVTSLEEKERMAERLRQNQKLSAMGNLAAGVAHEIGNPLNAIRLTSTHLKDILSAGDPEKMVGAARYAGTIAGEVDRLDELVQNFLTLAREREPKRLEQKPDDLLRSVLGLVRAEARRREIHLEEKLEAGDVSIAVDPSQMKGALVNIVVNAFDAAGEGGAVRIGTSRRNGQVDITVHDSGPGIPDEIRQRMFEPYFTTKESGTGLGLALSRSVVEQHGGTLEVRSQPGDGTTMTIALAMTEAT